MGQIIEKENLEKIKKLVVKYKECHDEIKTLEERMESLSKDMNFKLDELNSLRQEEQELYKILSEKYGSGYLDTQNIEWIQENK